MQYVNWSELRRAGAGSEMQTDAVHRLAERLVKVSSEAEATHRDRELAASEALEDGSPGLGEALEEIEALLPEWLSLVEAEKVRWQQHDGRSRAYADRLRRLERSGAKASAVFGTKVSFARDILPFTRQYLENARVYLTKTVALDPIVHTALREVEMHPDGPPALEDLKLGIDAAIESMELTLTILAKPGARLMAETAREWSHVSPLWREIAALEEEGRTLVIEGNALVRAGSERLDKIRDTGTT